MTAADGRTLGCDYWPVVVGGRYRGDLWLAWDMTERNQLEEQREQLLEAELIARRAAELGQRQLEMQNEKLRELDEAKTVFLATVSHELRTPLTSIVSFSELMRAETQALTADGAQFLDIIERNAHRLLRLVGDLLLLSRLESGPSRWSWRRYPSPSWPARRLMPPRPGRRSTGSPFTSPPMKDR